MQFVPGGGDRAVVLEKAGKAHLVDLSHAARRQRKVVQPSFLVLDVEVRTTSEMGLLGIAFHPKYQENGRFFLNYNPLGEGARTVIAEWHLAPADLGKKRATHVRDLLTIEQPFSNHNGGHLLFGPDGYLYIGMGDGGAAADPKGNGQNRRTLLGAMLRIDVNGDARPYGIPKDNPFLNQQDVRPEIWAYGLRNPWRYSFDPSGALIVADVGQNLYEEIDVVTRGANLGWNVREAGHCFQPTQSCRKSGLTEPIFEYGRDLGSSVTGGVVYTGGLIPALKERYLFADFVSGNMWSLKLGEYGQKAQDVRRLGRWPLNVSTFARMTKGEVIVASFNTGTLLLLTSP
jgi:glucose/arabinose dehydrogenase